MHPLTVLHPIMASSSRSPVSPASGSGAAPPPWAPATPASPLSVLRAAAAAAGPLATPAARGGRHPPSIVATGAPACCPCTLSLPGGGGGGATHCFACWWPAHWHLCVSLL